MADYTLFKKSIEIAEGGYQNFKQDQGNYNSLNERVGTNFGISARFYEGVIGYPPSVEDMKNITKTEVHILFKNEFWDKVRADEITHQGVAELIVDHAINAGPKSAAGIVQKTLNTYFNSDLTVDYAVGPKTLAAINAVDPVLLFQKIAMARLENYKGKKEYKKFGRSWRSRVYKLGTKFGIPLEKCPI